MNVSTFSALAILSIIIAVALTILEIISVKMQEDTRTVLTLAIHYLK